MARREPLIWLQLLGAAALPLELLLLLLLLAGADPGPVPALERLLVWAIGTLVPVLVLWKRPADPFSLLLVQTPLRARSNAQRTLAAAPLLVPRLSVAVTAILLLPGLWWIDGGAALAGPIALLPEANRLVDLLLTLPVLAVIVWQVQQLTQAAMLLLGDPEAFAGLTPLTTEQLETLRLSIGLPLLLPQPLSVPELAVAPTPDPTPESVAAAQPEPIAAGPSVADVSVAVEPEQPAEEGNSPELDQEIS